MDIKNVPTVTIPEPKLAQFLFGDSRFAWAWALLRIYVGWAWVSAGWHKVGGEGWGPDSLLKYWTKAVAIPAPPAKAAIAYDWYRWFLSMLIDANAHTWMASVVAWGELLVGVALIVGAFVGIAAFFGAFMNMNFMLAGSASTNPVLLLLAILLVLAWKTAGWWGLDRFLLPKLGVPWSPGPVFKKEGMPSQ
ncbi:MAG: DoxX family membrane protein [bacterium]|nr:DoxX family membrane protein [bacterium]